MKTQLESLGHGCISTIGGCLVARFGDWYYSAGDTVNVIHNTPRTIWGMLEFIGDWQAQPWCEDCDRPLAECPDECQPDYEAPEHKTDLTLCTIPGTSLTYWA